MDWEKVAEQVLGEGVPYAPETALRYRDAFLVVTRVPSSDVSAWAWVGAFGEALNQFLSVDGYGPGCPLGRPAVVVLSDRRPPQGLASDLSVYVSPSPEDIAALFRCARVVVAAAPDPNLPEDLLCAMAFRVPVILCPEVRSQAAALLDSAALEVPASEPERVAALVRDLYGDRTRVRRLGEALGRRLEALFGEGAGRRLRYLVDGPFETSYSLAVVNREAARALERRWPGSVGLDFLGRLPEHRRLVGGFGSDAQDLIDFVRRGERATAADVVLWNSYPPLVSDRPAGLHVLHSYGWEETGYPQEYVRRFLRCLDGVTVMSRSVRKILIDGGVPLPIRVVGLGVDHILRVPPAPYLGDLGRSFRFLSVSSAFPRKGLDALLDAYGRAFTGADDVSLVLKTFPNPHNRVHDLVNAFRQSHPFPPHIVVLDEDVPDAMMRDLYQRCHVFVAPTRGEGFGLPMAEAMLEGLPVIVTEGSGQADFCTPQTAWLVPARYVPARSHLSRPGSLWLEPDVEALARIMRALREATPEETASRREAARAFVRTHVTWDAWAQRTERAVTTFRQRSTWCDQTIPLVWVSTWGGRCGIAQYSKYLLGEILNGSKGQAVQPLVAAPLWESALEPDPAFVQRCWTGDNVVEVVGEAARSHGAAAVIVQYHPAFYSVERLGALIQALSAQGHVVWVTLHAVRSVEADLRRAVGALAHASRLAVHRVEDVNFFKELGLDAVTILWPHGVPAVPPRTIQDAKASVGLPQRRVIGTFGFLMPHKGLLPLLKAFQRLLGQYLDLYLIAATSLYPTEESARHAEEVRAAMRILGVERRVLFVTDFLQEQEALTLLQASDLIVFPYQHSQESSSAAVRFGIATGRPVACTPLSIFEDVDEVVHRLPGTDPKALEEGIGALLADENRRWALSDVQARWMASHAWPAVADRLERVVRSLLINKEHSEPINTFN